MPTVPLPFVGGAYDVPGISASQAVNCYPEVGDGTKAQRGIPGSVEFASLTNIRAMHVAFQQLYVVAGSKAYVVSSAGTATEIGDVGDDGLPASISHNIFELLFTSGGFGYTVQRGSHAFAAVADPDFPDAVKSRFIDGYILLLERNSGRFRFTAIDDAEDVNGVDFATAEGMPDELESFEVDHREVWLFGEESTEVWYNDGVTPFSRAPQGFIEKGCRGAFSPAKLDNTVFWLGNDNVVYRAEGMVPLRVSDHGIERDIRETTVAPIAYAYTHDGHAFYALNFPGELSVVYDVSTKRWHHRRAPGQADSAYHYHALAYGKHLVGGDKIYELDTASYQHDGSALERSRTIGPIRCQGFQTCSRLTFIMETGETPNLVTAQKVFLDISDDGGKTFTQRMEASVGRQGQRQLAVELHGLGGYYDNERAYRLTMTDNAKFTVVDAYAEVA